MKQMEHPKKLFCSAVALIFFVLSGADYANAWVGGDNLAPTITQPVKVTPSVVTGITTKLSVLADDDRGERGLTYAWSVTSWPSYAMPPTFSVNGTNAAKNTTATFRRNGNYTICVTARDQAGLSVSSCTTVTVKSTRPYMMYPYPIPA